MTDTKNRESLLLPFLIPVGALVLIVSVLFLLSRVLLNVSHTAATVTALLVATGIMVMATVVAGRKKVDAGAMLPLFGGVLGVAMLAGGGALILGPPHEEEDGGEPAIVAIAAAANAAVDGFSTDTLQAPADTAFTIAFDNQDPGVLHNVVIADGDPAAGGEVLTTAELITGPATADYPVEVLAEGDYFFFCEVHPTTMTGTLTAAVGETPGGGGTVVVAKDVAFDTDTIELPADQESSLTLDNQDDALPHNIAIYADESLAENFFKGEIFSGVAEQTYTVPALAAGEYFFHCDVHPNMAGTVVVSGDTGSPPEPEPEPEPSG